MHIRVIARMPETNEDLLLQGKEPEEEAYVWRIKYIKIYEIDHYFQLDKRKNKDKDKESTVLRYEDGSIDIIQENVDAFHSRYELEKAKVPEPEEVKEKLQHILGFEIDDLEEDRDEEE